MNIEEEILEQYFFQNINYNFGTQAKDGMDYFLNLLNQL